MHPTFKTIVFRILPWIVLLILAAYSLNKYFELDIQKKNVTSLNSELTQYKLKNGMLVSSVQTLQYDKKQLKKFVIDKDKTVKELSKRFSEVTSVTKVIERIQIDSVAVPYKDTVAFVFQRTGFKQGDGYSFDYDSNQKGIEISNLIIPDTTTIVSGVKKKWFWGKETYTVDLVHSNKHVKTLGIKHYEIIPEKKKFYQTNAFKIGVGGLIGGFIVYKVK